MVPITNYSISTNLNSIPAVPFELWVLSIILGVVLLLLSLRVSKTVDDVEQNAVICVMSWAPIAYSVYTSFAVDKYIGIISADDLTSAVEMHTVYAFSLEGLILGILLLSAIVNFFRIIALHKTLKLQNDIPDIQE